jgi:phosphoribosylaminoimidazolecarboxamide formyltransferase/IMP cyclohydrolase
VARGAAEAFAKALRTDTVSAYGGMIGFNAEVDGEAAERVMETMAEAVLAPSFAPEALAAFARRPGLHVVELAAGARPLAGSEIIRVAGGVLVQDWDTGTLDVRAFMPVTRRLPTDEEYSALTFAWKVCKHVRSDAVVYALADRTLGIGGGQPSRVYAARVGAINAQESLRGSVVASDGPIPSVEAIEGVKKAGATAIVQTGGFEGDARIIAAADEYEMAMIFTGMEHFKY